MITVVPEDPPLSCHVLREPDRSKSRFPQVPIGIHRHTRIVGHFSDSPLLLRLTKFFRKDSSFDRWPALPFPDDFIECGVFLLQLFSFLYECFGCPRAISECQVNSLAVLRLVHDESLVYLILFKVWIEGNP